MPVVYTNPKTGALEDPISIMKLGLNQQLNFLLLARKGIGKQHAKWSPVATCIMWREPIVLLDDTKVNQEMTVDQR